jgi:DNA-binding transcriptional MerR regulator
LYHFRVAGPANAQLTTAQLAERTGLSPATLRMWESRHGFPAPNRLPGGHRRYTEDDAEAVREVVSLRRQGLSLSAAIARSRGERRAAASVFAGLRRRRPDVPATTLPKRAVVALTRAIEDEYCARGGDGILIGSFQREPFYRRAERRWRELARTSEMAVALADFGAAGPPDRAPLEVPVPRRHPVAREWAVIVSADTAAACLAAWERPAQTRLPDGQRRFEVLWSFDPAVVADALAVVAGLLGPVDARAASRVAAAAGRSRPGPGAALDHGGALAQRMIAYLGAVLA